MSLDKWVAIHVQLFVQTQLVDDSNTHGSTFTRLGMESEMVRISNSSHVSSVIHELRTDRLVASGTWQLYRICLEGHVAQQGDDVWARLALLTIGSQNTRPLAIYKKPRRK